MAQTEPAVNIPSKKNVKIPVSKYALVSPPNAKDRKNPTHAGIQSMHVKKAPQKDDLLITQSRGLSNMCP
jgi:hypothetical protein